MFAALGLRLSGSDAAWRCNRQESDRARIGRDARTHGGAGVRAGGCVCGRAGIAGGRSWPEVRWPGAAGAAGMQLGSEDGRFDFIRAAIAGTLVR